MGYLLVRADALAACRPLPGHSTSTRTLLPIIIEYLASLRNGLSYVIRLRNFSAIAMAITQDDPLLCRQPQSRLAARSGRPANRAIIKWKCTSHPLEVRGIDLQVDLDSKNPGIVQKLNVSRVRLGAVTPKRPYTFNQVICSIIIKESREYRENGLMRGTSASR